VLRAGNNKAYAHLKIDGRWGRGCNLRGEARREEERGKRVSTLVLSFAP